MFHITTNKNKNVSKLNEKNKYFALNHEYKNAIV